MTSELAIQTRNAFDFVQKLYFEISYLIKEVEGLLQQQDDNFVILRSGGYSVTNRTSSGLEPMNVELWLSKTFTVFFCPENICKQQRMVWLVRNVEMLSLWELFLQDLI